MISDGTVGAPSSELRPPSRPVPPKHEGTGAHGPRHFSNWFDILLVLAGLADIYIIVPWACHGHLGTGRACRSCLGAHLFLNLSPSLSLRLSQTQREGLEIVPWAPMSFLYISLSDSLRLKRIISAGECSLRLTLKAFFGMILGIWCVGRSSSGVVYQIHVELNSRPWGGLHGFTNSRFYMKGSTDDALP